MVLLGFEAGCRVDPIGEHQAEYVRAEVCFQSEPIPMLSLRRPTCWFVRACAIASSVSAFSVSFCAAANSFRD